MSDKQTNPMMNPAPGSEGINTKPKAFDAQGSIGKHFTSMRTIPRLLN